MNMITNLENLCTAHFVREAIDAQFKVNIPDFTEKLNKFIHGYGSFGYDEADRYNLKTDGSHTEEEAKEILNQIEETLKVDKTDIKLTEIDNIPYGMAQELRRETDSTARTVCAARNTEIKFGIVRGHELVGFVSGNYWENWIAIGGLYVSKEYRGKGLSKKLLRHLMEKADEEGLKGLMMGDASVAGQNALAALKRIYDKEGNTNIEFEEDYDEIRNYASISFKDRCLED